MDAGECGQFEGICVDFGCVLSVIDPGFGIPLEMESEVLMCCSHAQRPASVAVFEEYRITSLLLSFFVFRQQGSSVSEDLPKESGDPGGGLSAQDVAARFGGPSLSEEQLTSHAAYQALAIAVL